MCQGIFADNNMTGFSTRSSWAASTDKVNAINISKNKIIDKGHWKKGTNLFTFYNNEITSMPHITLNLIVYIIDLTYLV